MRWYFTDQAGRLHTWLRAGGTPMWVFRAALLAGAAVVVLALAMLGLAALLVGGVVFIVLAAAARANAWLRGLVQRVTRRDGEGRVNVRVISRS
ncbi:MAG: hypothetical protein IT442_08735 [Phycisphaeraceae bacterium]|nr:hypothetical protein [Phycisphaeraceae bacterium]